MVRKYKAQAHKVLGFSARWQWRGHGGGGYGGPEPSQLKSWKPVGISQNRGGKYMGGVPLVGTFQRSNYLYEYFNSGT